MTTCKLDGPRRHKLLPDGIEKTLPKIGSGEGKSNRERKVPVKFFSPYNGWTWYGLEYDPADRIFYGLVHGFETEFGDFSLDELAEASKMNGRLPLVERDCHWDPNTTLHQVMVKEGLEEDGPFEDLQPVE